MKNERLFESLGSGHFVNKQYILPTKSLDRHSLINFDLC